jgi:hypothetical protein
MCCARFSAKNGAQHVFSIGVPKQDATDYMVKPFYYPPGKAHGRVYYERGATNLCRQQSVFTSTYSRLFAARLPAQRVDVSNRDQEDPEDSVEDAR